MLFRSAAVKGLALMVECWGANGDGQLGDGTTTNRSTPVTVSGLSFGIGASGIPVIPSVSAGFAHTCAAVGDALVGVGVQCWGNNAEGQLGDGTTVSSNVPVSVTGLGSTASTAAIIRVASGAAHSCALSLSGAVRCWGNNNAGQLGNGTTTSSPSAVAVTGLSSGVKAIAAGNSHSCAVTSVGGVKCWGDNTSGELGDGTTTNRSSPVDVVGLASGVVSVTAGAADTCALLEAGGVKCWGNNAAGQLGDATTTDRSTPVIPSGFSPAPPGAPKITAATAGNGTVSVSFTPSGDDRGAAPTSFRVDCGSLDGGTPGSATGIASPIAVGGLTNGRSYL